MRFERTFELLTSVIALLGFIALILPGDLELPWILLMLIGWFGSLGAGRHTLLSERLWRVFTIGFLIYVVGYYVYISGNGLTISRQLLIYLQLNRLYVRRAYRDYSYIYLLAFLQILLGCLLTVSPIFAVILLLFLMATGWGLAMLQMRIGMDQQAEAAVPDHSSSEGIKSAAEPEGQEPSNGEKYRAGDVLLRPSIFASSLVLTLLMLATTLLVFVLVPRMQMGLMRRAGGNSVHVAGFSEEVRLGEVGEIQQGNERVMRVWVAGSVALLGETPYWRGIALDTFDGISWNQAGNWRDIQRTLPVRILSTDYPQGANLEQNYVVENIDSNVLFAMPETRVIQSSLGRVLRDYSDSYSTEEKQDHLDYAVYSYLSNPDPEALRTESSTLPPRLSRLYLQLPPLSPEVLRLSQRLIQSAPTAYDRASSIQAYLRDNFEYTLNPQSFGSAPVEDFLFRTRAGHCEYFASAMVLMLRSVGIPSRIVNGFVGGSYNDVGGYYVVRQRDAHSWVEVWFEHSGWVRFDPTPQQALTREHRRAEDQLSNFQQYIDYFEMRWYSMLDYDLRDQIDLISGLITPQSDGRGEIEDIQVPVRSEDWRGFVWELGLGAGSLGALVWLFGWYRRQQAARASLPIGFQTASGQKFLRTRHKLDLQLAAHGLARQVGETPMERALRAEQSLHLSPILQQVETHYYAAQYGALPLDDAALQNALNALQSLRRLRPKQGS